MPTGTVKFFDSKKGFGFIQPDDGGKDLFVHITALEGSDLQTLEDDQRVSFDIQDDPRGPKAVNVTSA